MSPVKKESLRPPVLQLLALLGPLSTVCTFMSAMKRFYLFDVPAMVVTVIVSWAVYLFAFSERNRKGAGRLIGIAAAAVLPVGALLNFSRLTEGLADFVSRFSPYVKEGIFPAEGSVCPHENFVLGLLAVLITSVCVYAVCVSGKVLIVYVVTVPLAEICLFYGLVPSWSAFGGLMVFWAVMAALERVSHPKGTGYLSQTAATAAAAAVIAVTAGFAAAHIHERSEGVKGIREAFIENRFTLSQFAEDLRNSLFPPKDHKLTHDGELGNIGKIDFDGSTLLEVTMPADASTLYLKGFTGSDYNGTGWKEYTFEPKLVSKITSAEFIPMRILHDYDAFSGLETDFIIVRNTSLSPKARYYPSYAAGLLESDGIRRKYWGYFPSGAWQSRVIEDARYTVLPNELAEDEKTLRDAAYRDFLYVPRSFDCAEDFFSAYDGEGLTDELSYIRTKLDGECEYTLESGRKPPGKDFAKWFLTENKKGSCTHFATAAVLLCRSRGIPARYCEGFIISPRDAGEDAELTDGYITLSVPDNRAHAWAEIYIDGYGWMVFESTPGYGNYIRPMKGAFSEEEGQSLTEVTTMPPLHTEDPVDTSEGASMTSAPPGTEMPEAAAGGAAAQTVTEEIPPESSAESEGSDTRTETGPRDTQTHTQSSAAEEPPHSEEKTADIGAVLRVVGIIVLVLLCAAGLVILRRYLKKRRRDRLMNEPDRAVIEMFSRLERIASLNGTDISEPDQDTYKKLRGTVDEKSAEELINIALEARFGSGISSEKAKKALSAYRRIMTAYRLGKGKYSLLLDIWRFMICDYGI